MPGQPGGTISRRGTLPGQDHAGHDRDRARRDKARRDNGTQPAGAEHEGPGADQTAGGRAVTVTGFAPDDLASARPDGSGTGIPARRTAFDDLADQAARLPWCWPALVTLAFGFYQVGRPELWRDELASWSFASRPVPGIISSARHTGATQLAYYLL